MRPWPVLLLLAAACELPAPTRPAPACAGTPLTRDLPRPGLPVATALLWLDDTTLVVGEDGGTVDDQIEVGADARGVIVLDVAAKRVTAAYQGIAPLGMQRAPRELLITEGAYLDTGWSARMGVIDLATGCARMSPWLGTARIVIDPAHDGFVVAPPGGSADGHHRLERWDAATLTRGTSVPAERFDELAYDATTDQVVTSSFADTPIRVWDPVTLKQRAQLKLDVAVVSGFWLRKGEIAMHYETRCTEKHPRAMRRTCREPQSEGVVVVGLDPLVEKQRTRNSKLDAGPALPRTAASVRGMVAIETAQRTIEIRDASGTLVWTYALPRR